MMDGIEQIGKGSGFVEETSVRAASADPQGAPSGMSFGETLQDLLADTNRMQVEANRAVEGFVTGDVADVHDVMIAMTKADISFRLMLEVRNRLVEAYQEVMRMQV
jgi:flagellar hook-basal body complex protein FliE